MLCGDKYRIFFQTLNLRYISWQLLQYQESSLPHDPFLRKTKTNFQVVGRCEKLQQLLYQECWREPMENRAKLSVSRSWQQWLAFKVHRVGGRAGITWPPAIHFRGSHILEGGTLTLLTELSGECRKRAAGQAGLTTNALHGIVLGLAACVLSVPYDMPRWTLFLCALQTSTFSDSKWCETNMFDYIWSWFCSWLPEMVTQLIAFNREPAPIRSTVTKTVAEFRRTHSDTWSFQKLSFSEEQLEVGLLALGPLLCDSQDEGIWWHSWCPACPLPHAPIFSIIDFLPLKCRWYHVINFIRDLLSDVVLSLCRCSLIWLLRLPTSLDPSTSPHWEWGAWTLLGTPQLLIHLNQRSSNFLSVSSSYLIQVSAHYFETNSTNFFQNWPFNIPPVTNILSHFLML